jgi:hypothetical protein
MSAEKHEHLKHVTPDEHDAPDQWHQHSAAEKVQHAHGEIANAGLIIGVGILMSVCLVVTVLITYGYYVWYTTNLLQKQELASLRQGLEREALEYKSATMEDFKGFRWVAEEAPVVPKDTVQIPIENAMKKVAAEYASKKN